MALSREGVIDAAIGLVDADGLAGLTMRKLGVALGVDAMAVYRFFSGKAELLDAIVEREAARMWAVPGTDITDVAEYMVFTAHHYRRILLEHPNLAPLVTSRPLPAEGWAEALVTGIAFMRALGIAEENLALSGTTIVRFVLGSVLREAGETRYRAELGEDLPHYEQRMVEQAAAFGRPESPEAALLRNRLDPDVPTLEFDLGVRSLIHGMIALYGRDAAAPTS